jgi:hypothetical protein
MYADWYREALEDAGAPTAVMLSQTHPTARKEHKCSTRRDRRFAGECDAGVPAVTAFSRVREGKEHGVQLEPGREG